MTRKLLPATIIPGHLYVERSADRQLREIIEGMGRPGYVLVARQMGKTNLLLNARRTLESDQLLFVYVDLSVRLSSLSQYYKLILSTAESVHPSLFDSKSLPLREEYNAVEFEAALRSLLVRFRGRVVVVLDEIDSLANYPFSDQVFSQIRSMYFARSNYKEYDRLTYILSGVAEPADLIRDKNISPFNIGEKIYLSDFTQRECFDFLSKAGLNISESVTQRIYAWTGGNPRITWDVCAEIEIEIEGGNQVSIELVDRIVNELYLTSFDKAPVDHVRTIVQSDRVIRNAVQSIISGNDDEVSDKTRSRLYLAGIVSMQVGRQAETKLQLKNRILEVALSEKWLSDVEKTSRSLLQIAREHVEEDRYEAALPFYEEYLLQNDIEAKSVDAHRLALTYFNTGRLSKAVEWFERYLETVFDSKELVGQVSFTLGRAQLLLGDIPAATVRLRVAAETPSLVRVNAMSTLGAVLMDLDPERYLGEAERLCRTAFEELGTASDHDADATRASTLRTLAAIELQREDRPAALKLLKDAISIGSVTYQPYLLAQVIRLLPGGERRSATLNQLVPSLLRLISLPSVQQPDGGIEEIVLQSLVILRVDKRQDDFDLLLREYEKSLTVTTSERYKVYFKLSETALQMLPNENLRFDFLKELVAEYSKIPAAQKEVLDGLRELVVSAQDSSYVKPYIELRVASTGLAFTDLDFFAAGYAGISAIQRDVFKEHTELTALVSALRQETASRSSLGYCWLSYIEIDRQLRLGNIAKASEAARDVLELVEGLAKRSQSVVPIHTQMKQRAVEHLRAQREPERASNRFKELGRNARVSVRYEDGRIVRDKFKFVERDLVLGNCRLLGPGEVLKHPSAR